MPVVRFAYVHAVLALVAAAPLSPTRADEWVKKLDAVPALVRKAPAGSSVVNRCLVAGALDRSSMRRVPIRAAPRADARLLRMIPSFRREGGDQIAPQFTVIGARAGWLLIHNVGFDGYDTPGRRLFAGSGWIEARHMRVEIESFQIYQAPNPRSPLAADVTPSTPSEEARLLIIHGCSGSLLDVTMRLANGRTVRGWSGGACSNQVTTCGGGGRFAIEKRGRLVPTDQY